MSRLSGSGAERGKSSWEIQLGTQNFKNLLIFLGVVLSSDEIDPKVLLRKLATLQTQVHPDIGGDTGRFHYLSIIKSAFEALVDSFRQKNKPLPPLGKLQISISRQDNGVFRAKVIDPSSPASRSEGLDDWGFSERKEQTPVMVPAEFRTIFNDILANRYNTGVARIGRSSFWIRKLRKTPDKFAEFIRFSKVYKHVFIIETLMIKFLRRDLDLAVEVSLRNDNYALAASHLALFGTQLAEQPGYFLKQTCECANPYMGTGTDLRFLSFLLFLQIEMEYDIREERFDLRESRSIRIVPALYYKLLDYHEALIADTKNENSARVAIYDALDNKDILRVYFILEGMRNRVVEVSSIMKDPLIRQEFIILAKEKGLHFEDLRVLFSKISGIAGFEAFTNLQVGGNRPKRPFR